jgi:hypothetical protein
MRGNVDQQDHPIRRIKSLVDKALVELESSFDSIYGIVVDTALSQATGFAERDIATEVIGSTKRKKRATLAGDRGLGALG